MLSIPYYHTLIKKYVIIFGTLFNNIHVHRFENRVLAQDIKVPISYGPREKFLARVESNPTGTAKVATILPRMSFQITGMNYAPDRKLITSTPIFAKNTGSPHGNVLKKVYQPVPYDLKFTLSIMSKTTDDANRIIEQILPYFTPEWTVSARLMEQFPNITDIPVILDSVDLTDDYDQEFTERRTLVYTLNFTMKCYFYGPVTASKIIKITNIDMHVPTESKETLERITVQPGMDANGHPTTSLSETITYFNINEDDDYDYIVTITDLPSD